MNRAPVIKSGIKGYMPDEVLTNYMHEKLRFEKKRKREKLHGRELNEDIEYSRLKKRKIDVLDRIFRSMANLTFFFQCISEYPELADIFDDDVKDLLGIRRYYQQKQEFGFIF